MSTTDPVTLARNVLDRYESRKHSARTWGYEAGVFTDEILARAVIDMQEVVEEFAYAVTLDRGLSEWEGMCDHFVKKFHAALEGDNA